MSGRFALAVCAVVVAGCSGSGAPSEAQVKQALYTHYATAQGGAELAAALKTEVGVKDCKPSGADYRCVIENKALGSSIPMVFAHNKSNDTWTFVREER